MEGRTDVTTLLDIRGLTKKYGPITAVDDVSFSVDQGEVLGFIGPNGSGKSTTMKIVTGFLTPTSGTVEVGGLDVTRHPLEIKRRIGYLPEGAPLYGDMTPISLLNFVCKVRRLSKEETKRGIEYAVEKLHIANVLYQPIETLSKGYKRRVGLAQAIVHEPELLILDEPTEGIMPILVQDIRREIAAVKKLGVSILLVEQNIKTALKLCSRIYIMEKGTVVHEARAEDLKDDKDTLHRYLGVTI